MPQLSLVITTYNREPVLRRLLESLLSQSDPDFQVVVAIDGSTDGTESMLASIRPPYDLKWVNTHCTGYGLAVARNMGILAADGDAVVILDDDSFPNPGFVAAHKRGVTPKVITGGPRNPADSGNAHMAWKMRELAKLPPLTPIAISRMKHDWPTAYLIENNICLLRDDLIEMGLFSERVKMYGFVGQEFFGRAEFLGIHYQFNPAAGILHHGEYAGDNGLTTHRKMREARRAELLRPSLMKPRQYRKQIAWAQAFAGGREMNPPRYPAGAIFLVPWRYLRRLAREMGRQLRRVIAK